MRILITGSRNWPDPGRVRKAIEDAILEYVQQDPPPEGTRYAEKITVVHGACEYGGADLHAEQWAKEQGYEVEAYPVDPNLKAMYGNRAYYFRNKKMVDKGADVCLAFLYGASKGTRMTIRLATEAGIPVVTYT